MPALLQQAIERIRAGDRVQGRQLLVQVIRANPQNELDVERYKDSIQAADKAIGLDPDSVNVPFTRQVRGRACCGAGEYARAIDDFTWLIEERPSVMDFYYRGIAYQEIGDKEKAIADLEEFLRIRGGHDEEKIADAKARLKTLHE